MNDKVKVKYNGKAFVRGWKKGEERELPKDQANQFDNERAKQLGFKVLKSAKDKVNMKSSSHVSKVHELKSRETDNLPKEKKEV